MVAANRYAKALLTLAIEKGKLEEVRNDMKLINSVCNSTAEFVTFLQSPIIKSDKKRAILKNVFEGKVNELTISFLTILTDKRREAYIKDISIAFDEQYKKHKNILTAVITSASGIDDHTRSKVIELVKSTTSAEVELIEKTDKTIIGGFVLKMQDKQVDASVLRKLNDLRKNFSENLYIKEY
jgi:F-type H+-transporting ATPase subunit delta